MKWHDKSLFYTLIMFAILNIVDYFIFKTFIPCLIHKITGLYCPGCGISRMLISIFHFDFYQAYRYNPWLFILLILFILYQILKLITSKLSTKELKLNNYFYIGILIFTLAFGILRNLPYFSYLIPTVVK